MSHVDEGALHAYLDGALDDYPSGEARRIRAHLERCARCTDALAEARRLRDEAGWVLAAPELNVTPPPLEELRRLARSAPEAASAGSGGGVPSGTLRLYRFGWAASVVLALGVGWMMRGGLERPSVGPSAVMPEAMEAREAMTDVEPPVQMREETRHVAERPSSSSAVAADGAPEPAAVVADAGVSAEGATEAVRVAEGGGVLAGVTTSDEEAAMASVDLAEVVDYEARGVVSLAGAQAGAQFADTSGQRSEEALAAALSAPASPPVAVAESTIESTGGGTEAVRMSLARAAAQSPTLTPQRPGGGVADRSSVEAGDPGSLVVPGLEVLSIVWREEGVIPAGVRVLQRLEDGDVLELIHLPEGFDPSAVAPPDAGIRELAVPRDRGWLLMRARLDDRDLRALLDRMDAAPR